MNEDKVRIGGKLLEKYEFEFKEKLECSSQRSVIVENRRNVD